ncbi:hypothetical protein BCR34DRAFT_115065 [Clohesyomyces aquaticus]|uniref:Uncharacterized protein n=1 Tax=Clohesyomyces aquaticus TaxID=1231657 RepID=A0A1Y1YR54_9PLEO|nr:hypothetical protein BCR34DRAFT_115065 [Clohesyomyces aquaticus]
MSYRYRLFSMLQLWNIARTLVSRKSLEQPCPHHSMSVCPPSNAFTSPAPRFSCARFPVSQFVACETKGVQRMLISGNWPRSIISHYIPSSHAFRTCPHLRLAPFSRSWVGKRRRDGASGGFQSSGRWRLAPNLLASNRPQLQTKPHIIRVPKPHDLRYTCPTKRCGAPLPSTTWPSRDYITANPVWVFIARICRVRLCTHLASREESHQSQTARSRILPETEYANIWQ